MIDELINHVYQDNKSEAAQALNDDAKAELYLDFRTGQTTSIGRFAASGKLRAACTTINEQRTRGIQAIARQIAPRKPIQIDVWTAILDRNAAQWDVPLIDLSVFGIQIDPDGFLHSNLLQRLGTGAEATAWLDEKSSVFTKLLIFEVREPLEKKCLCWQMMILCAE